VLALVLPTIFLRVPYFSLSTVLSRNVSPHELQVERTIVGHTALPGQADGLGNVGYKVVDVESIGGLGGLLLLFFLPALHSVVGLRLVITEQILFVHLPQLLKLFNF